MDALFVFVAAALTTLVATPLAGALSRRVGAIAIPNDRRVHAEPTPELGGLGLLAGFLAGMLVGWRGGGFEAIFTAPTVPLGVVIAAVIVYAVGAIDDVREISAPAKTAGTVLAGSVLNFAGVSILLFRMPELGLINLSPDWAALVTVLWVVGMCQAINLIDGLDGLAAGIVAIAAGALYLFADRMGDPSIAQLPSDNVAPLVALATCGACVGFLPHNWNPASIFMGDGGALLLGLLMAAASIAVAGNSTADSSSQTFFFFAPMFIPLVILGVPIFDTAYAIVRRARRGSGVTAADKGHLHHRLMDLGHGQRRSVVILWTWTALLSGLVLYPVYTSSDDGALPIGIAALALLLYTVLHPRARTERRARRESEVAPPGP
jgi:UDP-GlcNAc:undecaprenyl-phosphate/decaprenyl-phosphate GlcNAc-1-phosphate transferase